MKTSNALILAFVSASFISCEKENNYPVITTKSITDITSSTAIGGGIIASNGKLPILSRGVCWSFKHNPTLSDNYSLKSGDIGSFTCEIKNLNADSTYYVKAYYINAKDTVYGNQTKFTTSNYILFNPNLSYGSVSDIDGNIYKTITIGSQTWMAENLKVTHFQNGDEIPNVTDLNKWGFFQITTSAYCWYTNDSNYKSIYGALYNWYAASDSRNIAPSGWHVASKEDWAILSKFLNQFNSLQNQNVSKTREPSTAHWLYYDTNAFITNETGLTIVPGGKVAIIPWSFMHIGVWAYFWTSDGTGDGSSGVDVGSDISISDMWYNCLGFSIRCVKD
jgi:uncharacterized protein (TIGR02145 family)